ncbi:MAG: GNAT family N-acetyltransferase [Candidatus Hodarchaeota archaeon]
MNIQPFSDNIDRNILINIRNRMRKYFNPEGIQDSETFESYIKPWDKTEPKKDFLVAKDDNGEIVGWAGLFKSSKFWSGIAILVSPEFITSNLPIELFTAMEGLAKAQNLVNLRLYVYGTFSVLREALDARGIKIKSGDFTLILSRPNKIPTVVIPDKISLRSSVKAERRPEYAETVNRAFREYASWQDTTEIELVELEKNLIESGYTSAIHFYALDQEKLVGIIHAAIQKSNQKRKKGLIVRLGVIPEYRRKQIGNTLLGSAILWLWRNNCSEIELSVIGENEKALTLYRNWGFKEVKEKTIYIYITRPYDELIK